MLGRSSTLYIGIYVWHGLLTTWRLQDIVVLRGLCARINHLVIAPPHSHCRHYCTTIARLLRNIRPPSDPLVYGIHDSILVMAISCKGPLTTPGLLRRPLHGRELCHFSSKRLEEKWYNWYSTAHFPLRNIGSLEGAHPIAAELTTCGLPGVEPQIVAVLKRKTCRTERRE